VRVAYFVAAAGVLFAVASVAEAQSVPPASGSCNLPHASGIQQRQLMSGGRERSYRLFVPPRYDGRTALPMGLDLHGSRGSQIARRPEL
jgi:poly(3-hydroxybutyrate) depolymerase